MAQIYDPPKWDKRLSAVVAEENTEKANEALRLVSADRKYGIGMALLAAWQHGITHEHIPDDGEVRSILPDETSPYVFVHVPVREFRRDTHELIRRGIMNEHADPALLVYHEDGLIGTFSFADYEQVGLTEEDLREILRALAGQRVLVRANIDNRQIQFKDLDVKRRIEASRDPVYVRGGVPLDRTVRLPSVHDSEEVWQYVLTSLQYRLACNYCSVQTLNPREVTINSALAGLPAEDPDWPATVRNYQMGFTFAPVGDSRAVCHFLAWDFPHISDLVMNMEPQAYSFSDLIRLVDRINRDIRRYYQANDPDADPISISGGCNHWAGNSIYHQHYQLMRLDRLPLIAAAATAAARSEAWHTYQGVEVRRMGDAWGAPALLISSAESDGNEQVMKVADKIAREWRELSDNDDTSYGNQIVIRNHTQNTFVTVGPDGRLLAIFIPRWRLRTSTSADTGIRKTNAGVLEMMGYFVIDSRSDFEKLERMTAMQRRSVGDAWLAELSPADDAVAEFESNVKICLDVDVEHLEQRIVELTLQAMTDWRAKAQRLLRLIQGRETGDEDKKLELSEQQRDHLYRELTWALLDLAGGDNRQVTDA
jgi:hypothetical protein